MAEIDVKSIEEAQNIIKELGLDGSINKPKAEEILEAAKEFEAAKIKFEEKKFEIGDAKKSDEIYDFVIYFMENHVYWTKNGWMGVLKMHEELTENKKNKKKKDAFAVGYQALEFMFFALTNPGGSGLETAKAIEKVADIYAEVMELSGKVLEEARLELKDIQWLGDKAASMQQGFYLEKEDGTNKEGTFASPTANDLLNKSK